MDITISQLNNLRELSKSMYVDKLKRKDLDYAKKYKTLRVHPILFWVYETLEGDLTPQGKEPKIVLIIKFFSIIESYIKGKITEDERNKIMESLIKKDLANTLKES